MCIVVFLLFLCRRVLELISTHIYLVVVFTEIDCTLLETCYCVYLYIYMFYRVTPPGYLSGFCFLNYSVNRLSYDFKMIVQ